MFDDYLFEDDFLMEDYDPKKLSDEDREKLKKAYKALHDSYLEDKKKVMEFEHKFKRAEDNYIKRMKLIEALKDKEIYKTNPDKRAKLIAAEREVDSLKISYLRCKHDLDRNKKILEQKKKAMLEYDKKLGLRESTIFLFENILENPLF